MRAVMPSVPPEIGAWRKRTGADRWDEMWEGVLHMAPSPSRRHQNFQWALETWLRTYWAKPGGNKVFHQINVASVGGWPHDYRIPDLVLLTPEQFEIDRDEYFEGPPAVVVEVRSPDDESYAKFSFYANLGVQEVWVIDRDTKSPEVYLLSAGEYQQQSAGSDGWVLSPLARVEMLASSDDRLAIRLAGNANSERLLPEE
jgi:Uma2 family endonuclease